MPPSPSGTAQWFEPRSDAWSAEFLQRLASLATAAPFGSAWLVARRSGLPGVVVVPGTPVAQEVIEAVAGPLPGRLVPVGAAALGVPGPCDRFAVVARAAGTSRGSEISPGPPPNGRGTPADPAPDLFGPGAVAPGGRQCHWFSTGTGRLAVRVRLWSRSGGGPTGASLARSSTDIVARLLTEGVPVEVREIRNRRSTREAWVTGRVGGFAAGPLERLVPRVAAGIALGPGPPVSIDDEALARHVVVVGASGAGKSSLLAELAAERIARGAPVVAFDLHGDLGPAIASRLSPAGRGRLLAVDASAPIERIPGVAMLRSGPGAGEPDQVAAHLVAALKRLTGEGGDVYWGFRL
ncbi:MAG TPA: DUF87 domain-containing protein, partial [Thermoplasmata archaeon]|nr:DUF87 domain-containing protein [Thermoplasmata archaeon]